MKNGLATVLIVGLTMSKTAMGVKLEQELEDQMGLSVDDSSSDLPDGNYQDSCQDCSISSSSVLTCSCFDGTGHLLPPSSLDNAWSCTGCITNLNGALNCQLPESSATNGYQSLCSGCGVSFTKLFCSSCSGVTPSFPYVLSNACTCNSVSFNNRLVCDDTGAPTFQPTEQPTRTRSPTPKPSTKKPTSKPTTLNPTDQPTSQPTTKAPTPGLAPIDCASYWLNINGNGVERAPWRSCTGGDFVNTQGCQYQNYCCWQQTSATTGVCVVPNGVAVDCPTITTQNACNRYPDACFWDASYGTSGLCRRICPGDPTQMCVF